LDKPGAPEASKRREGTQTGWPLVESLAAAMGDSVTARVRSIAHGITNQATTEMITARAAITMIAHRVTQIANGTRFRCMFPPKSRRNGTLIL
jgi:hypothetical protein